MHKDPRLIVGRSLLTWMRARLAAVRGTDPAADPAAGALSLEWVAIAIVLVTAALALAVFLTGKLSSLESLIPN